MPRAKHLVSGHRRQIIQDDIEDSSSVDSDANDLSEIGTYYHRHFSPNPKIRGEDPDFCFIEKNSQNKLTVWTTLLAFASP